MKNYILLYTSRIGLMALSLLTDVILSRLWGPELKGIYFLVVSLATQIPIIASLGVEYTLPGLAKSNDLAGNIRNILRIYMLRACLISVIISVCVYYGYYEKLNIFQAKYFIPYLTIVSVAEVCFNICFYYFISSGQVGFTITTRFLRRILFLLIVLAIIMVNLSIWNVLLIYLFCLIAVDMIWVMRIDKMRDTGKSQNSGRQVDWYAFALKLCELFLVRGVIYIGAFWLASESIGYLSVAMALVEIMLFLPNSAAMYMISLSRREDTRYKVESNAILPYVISLALIQSIIVWAMSGYMVKLLYGDPFSPAAGLVRYYAIIIIPLSGILVMIAHGLRSRDYRQMVIKLATGVVVLFLLSAWMIPLYGIQGLVIAHGLAVVIVFMMLIYEYYMRRKIRI